MARKSYSQAKDYKIYYLIEDYKKNGRRTTRTLETIGNEPNIIKKANAENISLDAWLNNYVKEYNNTHKMKEEPEEVIIKKYANRQIPMNKINKFNVGYLFLEDIYYSLKLDKIVNTIAKKYKFGFSLNEVLSYLVYSRIIFPSSKLKTYELSKNFIETPKYNLKYISWFNISLF